MYQLDINVVLLYLKNPKSLFFCCNEALKVLIPYRKHRLQTDVSLPFKEKHNQCKKEKAIYIVRLTDGAIINW